VFITATFGFFLRKPRLVATPRRVGVADATRQSLWPQYLVLGLNAIAIPVGLALFWKGGGLPAGALVANVLWASVTLGVAASALHFALRTSGSRRREYRFPLPIPLRVRAGRNVAIGLATDISPLGCRVVGAPVSSGRGGDELTGELLLPNGPLPVRMVVRTVLADGDNRVVPVALGCEFRWGLSDERNQLEMFLFGSDLQWRLNGFEDRVRTPLERVRDLLRGGPRPRRLARRDWSPVMYRRVNASHEAGIGFISRAEREGETRTIVSLGELPANGRLYAEEVTSVGTRTVVGRVAREQVIETHSSPIYIYELTA